VALNLGSYGNGLMVAARPPAGERSKSKRRDGGGELRTGNGN